MSQYDPKRIEELQMVLLKDPRSPVFASLAEAYRQMGLIEEALEVTTKGVKHNPEYVSGLVAHAKVLFELKDFRQAAKFLVKATALKPENILALTILGHCFLKMRKHPAALKTFKKLLILKPNDEKVIDIVKKWEFLDNIPTEAGPETFTVDGYDHWVHKLPSEEDALHLVESFINYGDRENALEIATAALLQWPDSEALLKRQSILMRALGDPGQDTDHEAENPALAFLRLKKEFYQKWLQRIEHRKRIDP